VNQDRYKFMMTATIAMP